MGKKETNNVSNLSHIDRLRSTDPCETQACVDLVREDSILLDAIMQSCFILFRYYRRQTKIKECVFMRPLT